MNKEELKEMRKQMFAQMEQKLHDSWSSEGNEEQRNRGTVLGC